MEIGLLDHQLSGATCVDQGVCAVCGNASGELDSTNHAGETEIKDAEDATCAAGGYSGDIYCKDCGVLLENGAATEATGEHSYGEWTVVKEATETATGEKQRTCTVCGHVDTARIPVVSHVPQTGDESKRVLCSVMAMVSLAALIVLHSKSGKRLATRL